MSFTLLKLIKKIQTKHKKVDSVQNQITRHHSSYFIVNGGEAFGSFVSSCSIHSANKKEKINRYTIHFVNLRSKSVSALKFHKFNRGTKPVTKLSYAHYVSGRLPSC